MALILGLRRHFSPGDDNNIMDPFGVSKPTTSGVTKKSKSGKQTGDDITLPLMDKNQGQVIMAGFCQQENYYSIITEDKKAGFFSPGPYSSETQA